MCVCGGGGEGGTESCIQLIKATTNPKCRINCLSAHYVAQLRALHLHIILTRYKDTIHKAREMPRY